MLQPRIIPCLLVHRRGLVKTVKFAAPKYVGDPINAVKIFNEKRVDELILLDIDATKEGRTLDLTMIENVAAECRMPLCYGGGIQSAPQAAAIFRLGVEKISISAAAVARPRLIHEIAEAVGNQSVVAVLDIAKKRWGRGFEVRTHNGTRAASQSAEELIDSYQREGVGEIVINSIDRDGTQSGYDLELLGELIPRISVPCTVLGGASSLKDIQALFARFGVLGAAAGSLFVFKGVYRAVLINYPSIAEKEQLTGG